MPQSYPSPNQGPQQNLYDPPSPHTQNVDDPGFGTATPASGAFTSYGFLSATPGPSTEYGRDPEDEENMNVEFSPSSAPATPSVKGTTHPSEFIHTHHPRRGSMTPLGLNVISPVAPLSTTHLNTGTTPTQTFSPNFGMQKSIGFNPSYLPQDSSPTMSNSARRSSAASTTSTLTQSRPMQASSSSSRDRRRSSLTPFNPTLAPPSPSRQVAKGRNSRPSSSDGVAAPGFHGRNRTEPPSRTMGSLQRQDYREAIGEFGRRGSMPHIVYEAGGSSRAWNPSLAPPRGSVGDEETILGDGFRFGSIPSESGPSSPATATLRAIDGPSGRRASHIPTSGMGLRSDVFEEAEAAEAEKQRKAFIAATFGTDGKRARERLSIGGPGASTPHGSPGSNMRRPSLMLWEKLGMQAAHRAIGPLDVGSASAPTLPIFGQPASFDDSDMLGHRRGSLPIAIPGGTIGRSSSKREQKEARKHDMDAPIIIQPGGDGEESSEDEEEEDVALDLGIDGTEWGLTAPVRPLPPLLPLSDPGPRLLPSTLALHRASHLLNARNLQPEPLPHPLPPSLHPPAPVDLAEFDIDFILAGSQAQLGGEKKGRNTQIDAVRSPSPRFDAPPTPTLRLSSAGGEDDTFAKFVGQFDDEYGDRRGEWTFRSLSSTASNEELRDPLGSAASRESVKAEWKSHGAGKYELCGNGEVRSVKSGSVWRVKKAGPREYDLESVKKGSIGKSPLIGDSATTSTTRPISSSTPSEIYCLVGKSLHCEHGGIRTPTSNPRTRQSASRANSGTLNPARAAQIRKSVSDVPSSPRSGRIGSQDSAATSRPVQPASLPLTSAINAMLPKKKRQNSNSRDQVPEVIDTRGRASVSYQGKFDPNKLSERSPSRERGDKDKKKSGGGIGGAFKRGLASIKHANQGAEDKRAAKEEKERERMQSQSWSGALLSHRDGPSFIHPSGRTNSTSHGLSGTQYFSHPTSKRKSSVSIPSRTGTNTPSQSSNQDKGYTTPSSDELDRSSEVLMDDDQALRREGKGWTGVPEDAVAMVIPIESDGQNGPAGMISSSDRSSTPDPDIHRQALLVWFVPFNSEEDRPALNTMASTTSSSRDTTNSSTIETPNQSSTSSSSLPKFQKLLRRRASKENNGLKPAATTTSTSTNSGGGGLATRPHPHVSFSSDIGNRQHPLPFRSFRIVARAVDWDELRSDTTTSSLLPTSPPLTSYGQWAERNIPQPQPLRTPTSNSSSQATSPVRPDIQLRGSSGTEESVSMDPHGSISTAPTSTIGTGRNFPTVIAVCHSRTQGVEFVLEGLDRLGFCQGESAWGPTGYEEWRGTGLSEKGRELLDLLWAGCVAVLGIAA